MARWLARAERTQADTFVSPPLKRCCVPALRRTAPVGHQVKRQPAEWERMLADHVSDKANTEYTKNG